MTLVQTINRTPIILEVNHDWQVLNTSTTGGNGSASNVTYASTDRWYQTQHWVYWATSTTTFTSVASTRGCHFRIYPTANNKTVLQLTTTTGLVTISSGNIVTITGASNTVVYVNNVQTTTVTLNTWNDVYISWDSYTCSNPAIGNSSFTWNIWVVRLFNAVVSIQEIQSLYMEGLRKLGGAGLAPLSDGLVAYYDFNGDANDIIGGNNGTVTGATLTTDRFSTSNRAYSFNGTTNQITAPSTTENSLQTLTLSMWINLTATKWFESLPVRKDTSWTRHLWGFVITTSTLNLWAQVYNWTMYSSSTSTLSAWVWYNAVMTISGSWWTMKFYVNWTQVWSNTTVGTFTAPTSVLSISWEPITWPWNAVVNGSMWEVMLYNRELSASEISSLYKLTSERYLTPLLF